jgi:prepilin-type N-terminal cleavage/methylation domain-containing protein
MRRSERGFTLRELLVTLGVVAVLATLLHNRLATVAEAGRHRRTVALVRILEEACDRYRVDYASWPPAWPYRGSQNLHAYLGAVELKPDSPYGRGGYTATLSFRAGWLDPGASLSEGRPSHVRDGWGRVIEYTVPGVMNPGRGDIRSLGRDPLDPADDIGNW